MSYRKIDVDGRQYEYVIGKTHVKVKGVGVWTVEELGDRHAKTCECCGEPLDTIYNELEDHDYSLRVVPSTIANKIRMSV